MVNISAERIGFNVLGLNHQHGIYMVAAEKTVVFGSDLSVHLLTCILAFTQMVQRFRCAARVVEQLP